ncbi:hypothetical protein P280DRAFT_467726 [Massarina eburnea CBS 473.64]|uniref:Uncharacterized protein n=1 Tax=Massarina eburnea CBS 473.64 TaxID=1395130 RepID=A0A6A6S451_9PLEO|nr:hypothetical protein P280DRAFT_467726 [Massarina eburnea CBS 473.64]
MAFAKPTPILQVLRQLWTAALCVVCACLPQMFAIIELASFLRRFRNVIASLFRAVRASQTVVG